MLGDNAKENRKREINLTGRMDIYEWKTKDKREKKNVVVVVVVIVIVVIIKRKKKIKSKVGIDRKPGRETRRD